MNIDKNLEKQLTEEGFIYMFCDYDTMEECEAKDANAINLYNVDQSIPLGTYLRMPKKKLVTFDYIMNKLNKSSVFLNLSEIIKEKFKDILNISVYPTSYGIGIFRIFGVDSDTLLIINNILDNNNIEYKCEYSDAKWVYRYKISKSSSNIEKLKQIKK